MGRRRLHHRGPGHSREVWFGGGLRDDAAADWSAQSNEDRRRNGCLRHGRLAGEERSRVERTSGHDWIVVRWLDRDDGAAWAEPCDEGCGTREPNDRWLDGRRLVPLRRISTGEPGLLHPAIEQTRGRQQRAAAGRRRLQELFRCWDGGPLG